MSDFDDYDAFSEFDDSDFERSEDDVGLSEPKREEPKREEPKREKVAHVGAEVKQKQVTLVESFREMEAMISKYSDYISELVCVNPDSKHVQTFEKYIGVALSNCAYLSKECEQLKNEYQSLNKLNNKLSLFEFEQKLDKFGNDMMDQVASMGRHIKYRACVNESGEKVELELNEKLVDSEGNEFQSEVQIPKDALNKIWWLLNKTFPW